MNYRKILLRTGILAVFVVLAVVYREYDPGEGYLFPKCPFHMLSGYDCPGCGSQRAVHDLLNLDLKGAFNANALLVLSIPYLLIGTGLRQVKEPSEKLLRMRKRLFGPTAIRIVFFTIVVFWILRNTGLYERLLSGALG